MDAPREIVVARGVQKRYHTAAETVVALSDVDLAVHEGEFLAVTGASGSGKTTLLNCLSGLDDIDAGSVVVDGLDLGTASDAQRAEQRATAMGFVFQSANLLPVFSAHENVALPMIATGTEPKEARRWAREALERVGLAHRLDHKPGELSGGEQQRVAIARAFARPRRLVWADEPTGNLDSRTAASVIALLQEMRAGGATLVLVTHDPALAQCADRRVEMRDGAIVDGRVG